MSSPCVLPGGETPSRNAYARLAGDVALCRFGMVPSAFGGARSMRRLVRQENQSTVDVATLPETHTPETREDLIARKELH